jgi:hypothetical protein
MAMTTRSSIWQQVHFCARLVGLCGLTAALVGAFIWVILEDEYHGVRVIGAGLIAVAVALIFETRTIAQLLTSRRGAFGINVLVQIVLALAIVGGANYYSLYNYKRFDLTQDQIFTLDENIRKQLAQMRGDTEIIVYQKYVTFGQRGESDPDKEAQLAKYEQERIDHAAQRKIIEKVKDLAEQFSDLGPRFRVHVLDLKSENADAKLAEIREISPKLADAVIAAPENSVFFYAKNQEKEQDKAEQKAQESIQRLSFSDIYQVDTRGSIEKKNLVLHYQGVGPFANKIFNIEAKKPRVANAIIHPLLGFQNKMEPRYTMSGAKKVLDVYGFDTVDLMLRKLNKRGGLTEDPTALTYDESRFEQIENSLAGLEATIRDRQKELDEANEYYKLWSELSLTDLNKKFVYFARVDGMQGVMLRTQMEKLKKSTAFKFIDVDEDDRRNSLAMHKERAEVSQEILTKATQKKKELETEKSTLKVEELAEKQRMTDIEARAKRMLAEVDLLIIPRLTIINAPSGEVIPNQVHKLDAAHLKAVTHFMREGKPVLFLLGPPNEPREGPTMAEAPDDALDQTLSELGFKLPKQTVLYDIESEEYNERKFDDIFRTASRDVELPGLRFDDMRTPFSTGKIQEQLSPHAIRSSLKITSRSAAKHSSQEIRVRHPRPVYLTRVPAEPTTGLIGQLALPGMGVPTTVASLWGYTSQHKPVNQGVFLVTNEQSWNEDNPFIVESAVPRFVPTKETDPKKGTLEEMRRGPFPIGVAVETPIPASWYDKDASKPKTARLAVIGSGGVFVGPELSPLKGKMLLDVVNWLIGRDDLLAREVDPWSYPRVDLDHREYILWQWGAGLALPLAFAFIGMVVSMARRMR